MSNKKRYLIVMIIGVALNGIFYSLALYLRWPVWLDMAGTAFAALALEPAAGLLVGLADNFLISAFRYDASSLVFYSLSAAVALLAGAGLKKDGRLRLKNLWWVIPSAILLCALLDGAITIWRGGIPNSVAEQLYYTRLVAEGVRPYAACMGVILVSKTLDILATAVIAGAACALLPGSLKRGEEKKKETEWSPRKRAYS